MKKIFLFLLLALCLASMASAQALIGAKAAGMGGSGVAYVTDLTSVYYNPAGLMKSNNFASLLTLSPSYTDYQSVQTAFSKATDPAQFLVDNYANDLSFRGNLAGMFGLNINKIGLSYVALPLGNYAGDTLSSTNTIYFNKPAGYLQAYATYGTRYDAVLTLGRSFGSLDVGVNLKSINALYGNLGAATTETSSTYIKGTGTGTAVDIGVRSQVDLPFLGSAAVGATVRDLMGNINYKRTSETYYFNVVPPTGTITTDAEVPLADKSVTLDTPIVIGLAANTALGFGVAADLEMLKSETISHLGLEYPILKGILTARAGLMSGVTVNKTTLGASINLALINLEATTIIDNKDSTNTSWVANITIL